MAGLSTAAFPFAAAAGLILSSPVSAQQSSGPYYGPHMWGGGWHGTFMGPLMMLVFFAIAVLVVVLVVRWVGGHGHGHGHGPWTSPPPATRTPLDILRERYARGEIDTAEYEERRRVLGD